MLNPRGFSGEKTYGVNTFSDEKVLTFFIFSSVLYRGYGGED